MSVKRFSETLKQLMFFMTKHHDNPHDESKTMTHRCGKLPDDGDPWASNKPR